MTRLKIDLKVMPRLYKGHKFILKAISEVTRSIVTIPIHQSRCEVRGDVLREYLFGKYCMPEDMIVDGIVNLCQC